MEEDRIQFLHQIEIDPRLGKVDAPFAPRFSPDGRRAIVLNGGGFADKGRLDDVLSIDMTLERPAFTEVARQVADGLESVAFHPRGHMAVVTCLGNDLTNAVPGFARLAVLDLATKPMQLLYEIPIEAFPEGIEFTADGEQLFVSCTCAHHIAAFDVVGYRLNRNPFILRTGHGPASMAIGPRTNR
jgi:streptogramin lyase